MRSDAKEFQKLIKIYLEELRDSTKIALNKLATLKIPKESREILFQLLPEQLISNRFPVIALFLNENLNRVFDFEFEKIVLSRDYSLEFIKYEESEEFSYINSFTNIFVEWFYKIFLDTELKKLNLKFSIALHDSIYSFNLLNREWERD